MKKSIPDLCQDDEENVTAFELKCLEIFDRFNEGNSWKYIVYPAAIYLAVHVLIAILF